MRAESALSTANYTEGCRHVRVLKRKRDEDACRQRSGTRRMGYRRTAAGIPDVCLLHQRPRRQRMRSHANGAGDFANLNASREQRVRNQRSMAVHLLGDSAFPNRRRTPTRCDVVRCCVRAVRPSPGALHNPCTVPRMEPLEGVLGKSRPCTRHNRRTRFPVRAEPH